MVWRIHALQIMVCMPFPNIPSTSRTRVDDRILFVIVNSLYSFWWDVVMDWNLTILTNPSAPGPKLWGLRKTIHFSSPQLYYTAIFLDFILRMTWSVKLSPHLHHVNELEGGIFFMETLEVIRRWIWIFFRFEAEWSKLTDVGAGNSGRQRGNSIPALELTKVTPNQKSTLD